MFLDSVWKAFGQLLESLWKVSGRFLEGLGEGSWNEKTNANITNTTNKSQCYAHMQIVVGFLVVNFLFFGHN